MHQLWSFSFTSAYEKSRVIKKFRAQKWGFFMPISLVISFSHSGPSEKNQLTWDIFLILH